MPVSPRSPYGTGAGATMDPMAGFMSKYVNNWAAVQQALAEANINADLLAALQNQGFSDTGDTTVINEAPAPTRDGGGRAARVGGGGFAGGGYARAPGQISSNLGGWGAVLNAVNGGGQQSQMGAVMAARTPQDQRKLERAVKNLNNGGTYTEPGRDRTRERSRTHTSNDGTTTTTTNVNISRNGGTAIARDSGSDGNEPRKKKRKSEMIY